MLTVTGAAAAIGVLENAPSTRKGRKNAVKQYNAFASNADYPQFADLTADYLNGPDDRDIPRVIELMQKYANYLLGPVAKNEKYYKSYSVSQYLSNLKTHMEKVIGTKRIISFNPGEDDWYSQLYQLARTQAGAEAHRRGESSKDTTEGIHRPLLLLICSYLMSVGDGLSYMYRAIFITLYLVVGRASETGCATFTSMSWHFGLGVPVLDWREVKTGKSSLVSMFPDSQSYQLDWFHAMGCYLLSGPSGFEVASVLIPDGTTFLFPTFVNLSDGGIAKKVTDKLKSLVGIVDGLTAAMTSHCFRAGASDDIQLDMSHHCCCCPWELGLLWPGNAFQLRYAKCICCRCWKSSGKLERLPATGFGTYAGCHSDGNECGFD